MRSIAAKVVWPGTPEAGLFREKPHILCLLLVSIPPFDLQKCAPSPDDGTRQTQFEPMRTALRARDLSNEFVGPRTIQSQSVLAQP